jgi:hypothetical protein
MIQEQDLEHLRLLSIFHYIVAGLAALFSCVPILHAVIGFVIIFAEPTADSPPSFVGLVIVIVAFSIIASGWALAFCIYKAGRFLSERRKHKFCIVIAAIMCIFTPLGTVLGVFTIIILTRPSVKALFIEQSSDVNEQQGPYAETP